MSQVIIFDSECISVVYLEDRGIIAHTIHQPVSGQIFRDALLAGSAAMAHYGACKWLSDDRNNGPLSPEDTAWAAENWYAPTIEQGWKYWANIVPQELKAAGSLVPVIEDLYRYGLKTVLFTSVEEATHWLDQCKC